MSVYETSMPRMTMISSDELLSDESSLDPTPSTPAAGRLFLVLSPAVDNGARGREVESTDIGPTAAHGGHPAGQGQFRDRGDPSGSWCA